MLRFERLKLALAASLLAGTMTACSTSKTTESDLPEHMRLGRDSSGHLVTNYKVGQPYEVAGIWYYPAEDYSYEEEGIASWYGPGFHGKRTANGEVYDMNALTGAHRTLPMPSVVRVTNLENGRSVKLRINDRGPFVGDRIIDLSRRAAQLLDVERNGTARVRVSVVPEETMSLKAMALNEGLTPAELPPVTAAPRGTVMAEPLPGSVQPTPPVAQPSRQVATAAAEPPPVPAQAPIAAETLPPPTMSQPFPPPVVQSTAVRPANEYEPDPGPGLYVQAGAFTDVNNARRLEAQLSDMGNVFVAPADVGGQTFHRVRVGPLVDRPTAEVMLAQVRSAGYSEARIVEQ